MYRTAIVKFVGNTSFVSHSYFLFISGQENCNLSKRNCITMAGPIISLHFTFKKYFRAFLQRQSTTYCRNNQTWTRM